MSALKNIKTSTNSFSLSSDVMDQMLEGIQIIDRKFRYVYANDSLIRQINITRQELIGYTMMEKYPGIEKTLVFKYIKKCFKYRQPYILENEFVFPDQTKRWFELSIQHIGALVLILSVDITDRKNAEQKLAESEKKFRSLVENCNEGMCILNSKLEISFISQSSINIDGYSVEDKINSKGIGIIFEDDEKLVAKTFLKVKKMHGKPVPFIFRILHKNGSIKWIEGTLTNLLKDKHINGIVANYRDVTHRIKTEIELYRSFKETSDYKFALNESCIVAITNQKGIILHANDNFCKISKYSREELIGQDHRLVNSGYHSKEFIKNIWKTITSGKVWRGEIKNRAKDGSHYWVDTTIVPFLNEEKKPYQYVAIRADITERKNNEEHLRKAETNYRELFNKANEGILVFDIDKNEITEVNQRASEITGFSKNELIKKGLNVFKSSNTAYNIRKIKKLITESHFGKSKSLEWTAINKNKSENWYELNMKKATIADKSMVLIFFQLINDRKNFQEELIQLNEKLEERVNERTAQLTTVNKELESFSYSVSHDLRAPLRALHGYSKVIEEDYSHVLDSEAKRLLGNIQYYSLKMGKLIDDLLSFSRMSRKEIDKSEVNVNKLVDEIVRELSVTFPNNAQIKIEKLHNTYADYAMIKQVWINLISNAIKYSSKKETPIISIGSTKNKNEVIYYVKDNGAGFDMKYAHRLFGVFQRLHAPEDFEGTGIGLAIIQRIISKHDGRIWTEAKLNEGATFYFTLPINNSKFQTT